MKNHYAKNSNEVTKTPSNEELVEKIKDLEFHADYNKKNAGYSKDASFYAIASAVCSAALLIFPPLAVLFTLLSAAFGWKSASFGEKSADITIDYAQTMQNQANAYKAKLQERAVNPLGAETTKQGSWVQKVRASPEAELSL